MSLNVDVCLENLRNNKILTEKEVRNLCELCKELLFEESNVQPVSSPVNVCGDIHGQFYDLLQLFREGGQIPDNKYIFIGDFVDRGYNSVETIEYLLCLKLKYPDHITLLRGNHECRAITTVYGFYDELNRKYGNLNPWRYFTDLFDYLPIGAIIDGEILCIHGGLSPTIKTIDQIRTIERKIEIPHEGPFCDIMWSDPEDGDSWAVSQRGAGWLFGAKVVRDFNYINQLQLICRAHQLVNEGYQFWFPDQNLVTIWSAPNYFYRCGNVASILKLNDKLDKEFVIFKEVPESINSVNYKFQLPYFL